MPGRWIIRLGTAARPKAQYLRKTFDGSASWTNDPDSARPFASKAEAERYGRNTISGAFHAAEVE